MADNLAKLAFVHFFLLADVSDQVLKGKNLLIGVGNLNEDQVVNFFFKRTLTDEPAAGFTGVKICVNSYAAYSLEQRVIHHKTERMVTYKETNWRLRLLRALNAELKSIGL